MKSMYFYTGHRTWERHSRNPHIKESTWAFIMLRVAGYHLEKYWNKLLRKSALFMVSFAQIACLPPFTQALRFWGQFPLSDDPGEWDNIFHDLWLLVYNFIFLQSFFGQSPFQASNPHWGNWQTPRRLCSVWRWSHDCAPPLDFCSPVRGQVRVSPQLLPRPGPSCTSVVQCAPTLYISVNRLRGSKKPHLRRGWKSHHLKCGLQTSSKGAT